MKPWRRTDSVGCVRLLLEEPGPRAGRRPGFNHFLSRRFTDNAETERIYEQMGRQRVDVLTRAQDAARPGRISLRPTSSTSSGRTATIDASSATAPNAGRHHLYLMLDLMLDAYRAERAHPLLEPPMTN